MVSSLTHSLTHALYSFTFHSYVCTYLSLHIPSLSLTYSSFSRFDPQDLCVEDDTILLSAINGNDTGGSCSSSNGNNGGGIGKSKGGNDVMGALSKGMERTDEMLTTDSVLLLRKADTLINKAKSAMK